MLGQIYTAIVSTLDAFLAGDFSVNRVARGLKLVSIDGIWSSRQNETDFSKIGLELWSPGPKNQKKSNSKIAIF